MAVEVAAEPAPDDVSPDEALDAMFGGGNGNGSGSGCTVSSASTSRWCRLARRSAAALGTTKSVSLDYDASLFTGPALGAGWSSAIVRIGEVAPVSALTIAGTRASDPAAATAKAFAAELRRQGVKVTGIAKAAAPGDAAELARDAEVGLLALTHLSNRYFGPEVNPNAPAMGAYKKLLK
mgnify:CR=1 FL=1